MKSLFWLCSTDAVEYLRSLADLSVDLVITDPPYESLEKHRAIGTTTRLKHSKASSNDWFKIFPNARFAELFCELYRILKHNSHLYLFCDPETAFIAKPIAEAAGFKFWKPLIWDKKQIGMGYHYRARYEFILFFEKGKRRLNDLGISDIIEAPRIHNGYPTEKPSAVSEVLVRQSSSDGDLVIDPFMGSGSVGVAAASLNRNFAGSDICAEAVTITRTRLLKLGAVETTSYTDVGRIMPAAQEAKRPNAKRKLINGDVPSVQARLEFEVVQTTGTAPTAINPGGQVPIQPVVEELGREDSQPPLTLLHPERFTTRRKATPRRKS